jgi:NAD(P)-dependent dehydrogenase (short-subunit alcohol dehydrogenase family)
MPTVMITGANRGLGLEFTKQYAADGWTVIATCRDPFAPGELATIEGDIQVHGLEVANHPQVDKLANDLRGTAIDVLLNNAGMFGPRGVVAESVDFAAWEEVQRVNVFAPLKIATAFAGHVAASDEKKIVCISSIMASIECTTAGSEYIYRSTKTALNMAMRVFANDPASQGATIAMFHPGWVQTDMGGTGADIDAVTSITNLRRSIAGLTSADSGKFFNYDGTSLPW